MTGGAPTTRLEPTTRGRERRHVAAAAAIVAFIGIALLKPWAADVPTTSVRAEPASSAAVAHVTRAPRTATADDTFSRLLERARPYAGEPVVVGRSIPRYGTPVTTILRRPSGRAKTTASNAGWCTGGVWFDSPQRAIAFGHSYRVAPAIDVFVIARNHSGTPVKLTIAPDAVRGLSLVAPAGADGWLPGRYDVTLRYAARGGLPRLVERFMLCFRTPPRMTP